MKDGDVLVLEEWDKEKNDYTGRKLEVTANYILKTKDCDFWPPEDVEKYGFQIVDLNQRKSTSPKTENRRGRDDFERRKSFARQTQRFARGRGVCVSRWAFGIYGIFRELRSARSAGGMWN